MSTLYTDLSDNLSSTTTEESFIDYVKPEVGHETQSGTKPFTRKYPSIRTGVPSRLDAPLLPYSTDLRKCLTQSVLDDHLLLHESHKDALTNLLDTLRASRIIPQSAKSNIKCDIESIKQYTNCQFSTRYSSVHNTCMLSAESFTMRDLSNTMNTTPKLNILRQSPHISLSFLYLTMRIRSLACIGRDMDSTSRKEASIKLSTDGPYTIFCTNAEYEYEIYFCGEHFYMYHSKYDMVFIGPVTYYNYLFTIADVANNVEIIQSSDEYQNFVPLLKTLINTSLSNLNHNSCVDFFKNYEALCLYMADVREGNLANWDPIKDVLLSMCDISNELSEYKIKYDDLPAFLLIKDMEDVPNSLLGTIIHKLNFLTNLELLEASTLHKFVFFAEVDSAAGLDKYQKRTFTKRTVQADRMTLIMSLIKKDFIISYAKKHNKSPVITYPEDKATILLHMIRNQEVEKLESYPLNWWSEFEFGKTLDWIEAGHPVQYAKDKGAIVNEVTFSPLDNKRELTQILEDKDYKWDNFLDDISVEGKPQRIYKTTSLTNPVKMRFPVRLCDKEKEQKVMSRLFGVGTARFKHRLSEYMAQAKEVLGYFPENFMTLTDKSRKSELHRMAQELSGKRTCAIMLDIEGHNQSMQQENVAPILEFMGSLYGEKDWSKLTHLFKNLTVYYYDAYQDDVTVMEGQLGGIEGWMNPVWTLVTLAQARLLRYTTHLNIKSIAVYSDDVAMTIEMPELSQSSIKHILHIISAEFFLLGFIIKPSQSAVSKVRITMLRQHYLKGIRSDSTLKRLLSVTCASSSRFSADDIEVSSISSTISSALEGSYHITTCTFLKWYKSCLVNLRVFCTLFEEPRYDSIISPSQIPDDISRVLYNRDASQPWDDHFTKGEVLNSAHLFYNELMKKSDDYYARAALNKWLEKLTYQTIDGEKAILASDYLIYKISENMFFQDIWFLLLSLPASLGGLGVDLLINQILSGHSDNTFKVLYYLHRLIGKTCENKPLCYKILQYSLKYHYPSIDDTEVIDNSIVNPNTKFNEYKIKGGITNVIVNKWMTNNRVYSSISSIQAKLMSVMRRINVNLEMGELINMSQNKQLLSNELIKIFKSSFSHRVVQFYYENSKMGLVTYLLRKLETSTSLLNKVKDLEKLKQSLTVRTRSNYLSVLSVSGAQFGQITGRTDIMQYMIDRRREIVPELNFTDIEEPLYDHLLTISYQGGKLLSLYPSRPEVFINGGLTLKEGLFESVTNYKGEITSDELLLTTKEEMLISKLLSITKWSLTKLDVVPVNREELYKLNFVAACNVCLNTFTPMTYIDLEAFVPTNNRGELLHRIPNQKFKNKVSTRILPNTTQNISCVLDQGAILDTRIEDTNINFEYLRLLMIMRASMDYHYNRYLPPHIDYTFSSLNNIYEVREFRPSTCNYNHDEEIFISMRTEGARINFRRISAYSNAFNDSPNMMRDILQPNWDLEGSNLNYKEQRISDTIYSFYRGLKKEFMIIDIAYMRSSIWQPLYSKLREMDHDLMVLTDVALGAYVTRILSNIMYKKTTSNKYLAYNEKFKVHIREIQAAVEDLSAQYKATMSVIRNNLDYSTDGRLTTDGNIRLRRMQRVHDEMIFDSFIDLSTTYCLHLKKENAQLHIDADATYNAVVFAVRHGNADLNIPLDQKCMIYHIGMTRYLEYLTDWRTEMIDYLENLDNETPDLYFQEDSVNIKFKSIHKLEPESYTIPVLNDIVYGTTQIFEMNEQNWATIEATSKFLRKVSELYSSPETFTSPTGSDSLVAQYGIFSELIAKGIYNRDMEITSLASGRGDGLIAADMLGLNMKHYSKPSLFSQVMVIEGVECRMEYDLTKFETLGIAMSSSAVFIDISNISGQKQGLLDTILNFLREEIIITIRLNSLDMPSESFFNALSAMSPDILFHYPTSRDILPYQLYYTFIPRVARQRNIKYDVRDDINYKLLLNHLAAHISSEKLSVLPATILMNSMMMLLPEDLTLSNLIDQIDMETDNNQIIRALKQLQRLGEDRRYVNVDKRTYDHISYKLGEPVNIRSGPHDGFAYVGRTESDLKITKSRSAYNWRKSFLASMRGHTSYYVLDTSELKLIELKELSYSHPIGDSRSLFKNMSELIESGIDVRGMPLNEFETFCENYYSTHNTDLRNSSRKVKEVLALLVLSATRHDYVWGLEQLYVPRASLPKDRRNGHEKISIYRKLGPLYLKFRQHNELIGISLEKINKLEIKHDSSNKRKLTSIKKKNDETTYDNTFRDMLNLISNDSEEFMNSIVSGAIDIVPSIDNHPLHDDYKEDLLVKSEFKDTVVNGEEVINTFIIDHTNMLSNALQGLNIPTVATDILLDKIAGYKLQEGEIMEDFFEEDEGMDWDE